MKKIAIVLFASSSLVLSSCGGSAEKCEGNCADSTAVVAPATDSVAPVAVDSTKADTASVK